MNNLNELYKKIEDGELDGEIGDKEMLLELLKCSTLRLLYVTEGMQKYIGLFRRGVEVNRIMIDSVVFDVCDRKIIIEVIKHCEDFKFHSRKRREGEDFAEEAFGL